MTTVPGLTIHGDDQAGDALAQMQVSRQSLAVVTDSEGQAIGTVLDGDIRRASLAGIDMTAPVAEVMGDGRHGSDVEEHPPTIAVILAGGRGQRLRPVTDKVPKAFLTVGRTTIIERLLEQLWSAGIADVYLAVNYKAEVFEQRLGDGEGYGVKLHYLREHKPLHTAGPLSLLPEPPTGSVLVMNADQVTALNFGRLVDFHRQQAAAMTIGAFVHEVSIPYGVLRLGGEHVLGIEEKPTLRHLCNAGIYVLEPYVVDLVPRNTFFGMPSLADAVLAAGRPVAAFPILEKFIDIGTPEELEAALLYFATGEEV
jgi:NDP-sugar pyrophosphorylase family protein